MAVLQAKDLNSHLKSLINSHKLMLFMKGDRHQPQCGRFLDFPASIVEV